MFEELARAYRYWHSTGDRTAYVCDLKSCGCRKNLDGCVQVVQSVMRETHDAKRGKGELVLSRTEAF